MLSRRSLTRLTFVFFIHCLLCAGHAFAQDTIRANPNAVALRSIWSLRGADRAGVGNIVAALDDLDGDGRAEFGVESSGDLAWRVYGIDSTGQSYVKWEYPARSPRSISTGSFWGPSWLALVYPRISDTIGRRDYYFEFFDVDSGMIAGSPRLRWSSRTGAVSLAVPRFLVADLDRDGDDEFIVYTPLVNRNGVSIYDGEIWIYAGGPEFQVDTPTVVIRDDKHHGNEYALHIGRVDADEYPDLVCVTFTGGRIRWGGADIAALDRPIDREFAIAESRMALMNADGDDLADLLWKGAYLHLSSSGKDPRTRGFDQLDADRHFVGRGTSTFHLGPLNDSADRYDMWGVNTAMGDNVDLIFSGAHNGPDARYDATYSTRTDGLGSGYAMRVSMPAGDIDGNGWRDFIAGNEQFGDGGLAVVIGGGPYIPRDSMPASAIRDITVDGRHAAITVWPNPTTDVVHIAWRGDLSRTPARFAVHDALGRLVAHGDAESMRGEVIWQCADRPAGMYFLTVRDRTGATIATLPVVKQ